MQSAIAYCWASGEIEILEEVDGWAEIPEGAIEFARGEIETLRARIEVNSRHGHQPGVYLVPGLPEFDDSSDPTGMSRVSVLMTWVDWAFADWPTDVDNRRIQPTEGLL